MSHGSNNISNDFIAGREIASDACSRAPLSQDQSRIHSSAPARHWLTLIAIAFCAEGAFLAFFVSPVSHGIDFYHVNFVPAAVKKGFDIYDLEQHPAIVAEIDRSIQGNDSKRLDLCVHVNRRLYQTGFCPTATPLLYTLHALPLVGPFDVRYWIFHIAATFLGVAGLFVTARACGLDRQVSWLICGLVMSFCWAIFLDAQLANVSRIQLFGLGVAFACSASRKNWGMAFAGMALAVGTAYKPTILPSIVFWLVVLLADRRWTDATKAFGGLVTGSIFSFLLPLALFPSLECWWDWKRFASAELSALSNSFPGNYSLQAAMSAIGFDWMRVLPWGIGAFLLVLLIWTARTREDDEPARICRDQRLCLAIALGPLWTNLASPLTWVQYSALTMPLAIVLIGIVSRMKTSRGRWISAVIIAAALSGGLLQRFMEIESHWIDCALLWAGWLGLLLISFAVIAVSRPTIATRDVSGFATARGTSPKRSWPKQVGI